MSAVDAGFFQRAVEHLPGGTDERLAGEVFLVARLLADQHDPRGRRAFAEHGLGRVLVERAGAAIGGFLAQGFDIVAGVCEAFVRVSSAGRSSRFCGLCGSVAALRDHRAGGAPGAFDQGFNQRGLRQVPPVLLRHLVLHRLHLQPRRVEDAGVVAPPGFLQAVGGRRLGLG